LWRNGSRTGPQTNEQLGSTVVRIILLEKTAIRAQDVF